MSTTSKPAKRILIVSQHYWPEPFRIADIAEGLVERGYEVDVFCGTPNYPTGTFFKGYGFFGKKQETHKGVKIYRVPEIPRGSNTNFRILLNYVSFPFFAIPATLFFLNKKYDRIIAYQLSPVFMSFPAIILSKLKRVPLYFYVCDFWPHSLFSMIQFKSKVLRTFITRFSYWHYRRAAGIIGVFKGMQERFISDVHIPKERTLYIPQAPEKIYEKEFVDTELASRFKDTFNIVFAGNINPAQCFDVIVPAAKKVFDAGYTSVRYIILGDGMSRKTVEEEVHKLGLEDIFVFEGLKPVEDVPRYQSIADATIVALSESPLFEYGIPAKVYSYMPAGKPILGSMNGEGKKLINSLAECGICVDSGDTEGLADSIMKLVDMPDSDRKALGLSGKKYYFEHFERSYNLDRLEQFVMFDNRIPDKEYED